MEGADESCGVEGEHGMAGGRASTYTQSRRASAAVRATRREARSQAGGGVEGGGRDLPHEREIWDTGTGLHNGWQFLTRLGGTFKSL